VTRIGTLFVLLFILPAHAETVAVPPGFDPHLITDVYATALAFMAPRTLEPVAVSQLTIWGLRGLTALDPELTAGLRDGKLRLAIRDRELAALLPPAEGDFNGWAGTATALALAAAGSSAPVRRAGTQGVVQSFFDELFNHLDPYSRYVPPRDAGGTVSDASGRPVRDCASPGEVRPSWWWRRSPTVRARSPVSGPATRSHRWMANRPRARTLPP
jgi:carboxyl-terminal processing protease